MQASKPLQQNWMRSSLKDSPASGEDHRPSGERTESGIHDACRREIQVALLRPVVSPGHEATAQHRAASSSDRSTTGSGQVREDRL